MKVSRDYIGNLIQHRKTQSLCEKTLIGPKRAVFNFFQSSMGGGLTPKIPPCVRHWCGLGGSLPALCTQGRREKFRAPGQKFCLGPLVRGAPKSRNEQKKGHSVRRCSNFGPKLSDEQKKVIASADVQISAQHLVMSEIRS